MGVMRGHPPLPVSLDDLRVRVSCASVPGVARGRAVALDDLDHVAPAVGPRPVQVGEAVDLGELAAGQRLPAPARPVRIARERGHRPPDVPGALRDAEVRRALGGLAPVRLLDAVDLEHRLRAHPAGRQRDGGASVRPELLGQPPRHADHRRLRQVVEHRDAVVVGVVFRRSVGHLDHQAPRAAHQQRQRMVARDQVGVDREAQHSQAALQVVLPDRLVPVEQVLGAPDVVDEHVEAAVL